MVLPFVQLKATRVSTTTCGEICHPEIKPNLPDTNAAVKKKKSLFDRFLSYFNDANKNKKQKKFDFSIIGGPHYSEDTKLGLGLVAAGLYKTEHERFFAVTFERLLVWRRFYSRLLYVRHKREPHISKRQVQIRL